LKNWVQNGWLHTHNTSPKEIERTVRIADRDLNDCQTKGLSNDWKLAIAYNAGLQLAMAALAASGYRTSHEATITGRSRAWPSLLDWIRILLLNSMDSH